MKIYWQFPTFDPVLSYYNTACQFVRGLRARGVDVVPLPPDAFHAPGWVQALYGPDIGAVPTVVMATPGFYKHVYVGRVWALTMYESSFLPDEWPQALTKRCERVIVPCQWNVELFERAMLKRGVTLDITGGSEKYTERSQGPAMTIPVHLVPLGIDTGVYRYEQRPEKDVYTFLAFGDRSGRKGWDLAWRAFYQAFGGPADTPDVRLIFKMVDRPGSILYYTSHIPDRRIRVWREDAINLAEIYSLADCLVFPTRGEGYGYPPRDAAATGLPVIATDGQGLAGEVAHWGLPLHWREEKAMPPYDGVWMDPDFPALVFWMRWCYDHRDAAKALGKRSADWIRQNASWEFAIDAFMNLLEEFA